MGSFWNRDRFFYDEDRSATGLIMRELMIELTEARALLEQHKQLLDNHREKLQRLLTLLCGQEAMVDWILEDTDPPRRRRERGVVQTIIFKFQFISSCA